MAHCEVTSTCWRVFHPILPLVTTPQNRKGRKMTADQSVATGDRSRLARRAESVVSDRHTLRYLEFCASPIVRGTSTTARGTLSPVASGRQSAR